MRPRAMGPGRMGVVLAEVRVKAIWGCLGAIADGIRATGWASEFAGFGRIRVTGICGHGFLLGRSLNGAVPPCPDVPGAGLEPARPKSQDFKSCMSTNSIIRAGWGKKKWRRRPDLNRR